MGRLLLCLLPCFSSAVRGVVIALLNISWRIARHTCRLSLIRCQGIKGSFFGGGGGKDHGLSYCFCFKVPPVHPPRGKRGPPVREWRRAFYLQRTRAWPAVHLFIYLRRALLSDFQHSFLCSSPFLFVQKGKVQSGPVSRGRSLLNTNPPAPARADLDRGAINASVANPHVCFVRPGREGSGLT